MKSHGILYRFLDSTSKKDVEPRVVGAIIALHNKLLTMYDNNKCLAEAEAAHWEAITSNEVSEVSESVRKALDSLDSLGEVETKNDTFCKGFRLVMNFSHDALEVGCFTYMFVLLFTFSFSTYKLC